MVKDTAIDYISADPLPTTLNGDTLIWNIPTFNPFTTEDFHITFHVDSTIPLSQPILTLASIDPILGDTVPTDNIDSLNVVVIGSFDPNDKQVMPQGVLDNDVVAVDQELTYTIRFQNTGTYQATTVKVTDELSNWLDIPSFDFISSSHPCTWRITGTGNLEFLFNNINLPDENTNEAESHGFVKFSIHCKKSLSNGGTVLNTGKIYFDFNAPIITNTTENTVKGSVSTIANIKEIVNQGLQISPNPSSDYAKISFNNPVKEAVTLEVVDVNGKIVITKVLQSREKEITLNTSNLSKGNYVVRVKGQKYNKTSQLIVN